MIRLTQRQRNTVEAESGRDTTLVIYHRESGWRFCDDGSGFGTDALVTFRDWPIDTYDVYVGSYWRSDDHDYSLYVDR